MTMNYSTTMRFIELMRTMPGLWDRNHRDYLNKDVRNQLKVNLSKMVGLTSEEVGKKIQNLRTYFVKECQKRDRALYEGHLYEPKWPYFDALAQFWPDEPIPKKRPLEFEAIFSTNYSEDGTSNSGHQEAEADDPGDNGDSKRMVLDEVDFEEDSSSNDGGDATSTSPSLKRIKTEPSGGLRSADCIGSASNSAGASSSSLPGRPVPVSLTSASARPSSRPAPQASGAPDEDEDALFGRYIVKELRLIKNFRVKQLTKLKVQQAVIQAQLEADELRTSAPQSARQSPTSAS